MINETLRKNINVDKENILPISTFKEGDNAILKLALFKNSTEFDITGQTVRLGAKTKSGLIEQIDGFTISKNNLDIELKNSILVAGKIEIDLEIKDTNGVMTTASFFIVVNQKVLNDEAVEATNEFDTFTKAIDKVETAVKTVTSHTDNTIIHITSAERSNWDSKSNLALGETETTAYRGDLGKKAYTHSQTTHAPSNAQKNVQSDWNVSDTSSDAYIKNKPVIPKAYDDSEIRSSLDNLESEVNELKEGNINIDLTNYVTKSELSTKADKTELHSHSNKNVLDEITSDKVSEWNNKSTFSGNYNDLTNKPTIPSAYDDTTIKASINTKANITDLTSHTGNAIVHVTSAERTSWNAKSTLALGTTSSTAYRGDYGNTAYTHSQSAHAPSNAQKNSDITKAEIEAKLTGNVASHTHSQYLTEHQDLSLYAKTTELTLGVHADGLIYLFKGGQPLGSGVEIGVSGDIVGYVDSSKNIVLKGSLADGDYTVKYEMNDGTLYNIGAIKLLSVTYTNLFIPSSAILNKRINSSYALTDAVGKFVTSSIDVKGKTPFTSSTKIYIKGATFTPDGNTKILTYKTTGTAYNGEYSGVNGSTIVTTDMGNGVICVDFASNPTLVSSFSSDVVRFIMVLQASTTTITASDIEDVVITINEPI